MPPRRIVNSFYRCCCLFADGILLDMIEVRRESERAHSSSRYACQMDDYGVFENGRRPVRRFCFVTFKKGPVGKNVRRAGVFYSEVMLVIAHSKVFQLVSRP